VSSALSRGRAARGAFEQLARAQRPVLFLDLDGTLAPLVARPMTARVPPSTRRIIQRLRRGGATVVLVSGRSVVGVQRVAQMRVDAILGDHGARLWRGGQTRTWLPANRSRFLRIAGRVAPRLARMRGVRLEQKDRSFAIHLRLPHVSNESTSRRITRLLEAEGMRVLRGRRVLDAQLPGVDKGRAVRRWLRQNPRIDAVLYAGDDTTDHDAFRALGSRALTIAVGPRLHGALLRSRDPATFAAWLGRLAEARLAR